MDHSISSTEIKTRIDETVDLSALRGSTPRKNIPKKNPKEEMYNS